MKKNNIWQKNYINKRYNKYPFDEVVSFVMRNFKKNKSKIKILDFGCGGGNNTLFLKIEGFDVYAIDGSAESIKITKEKLKNKIENKKIFRCDFKKTPFKNNTFDCIIDRQSLGQNSFKDIKKIVKEVKRILKRNGFFFSMCYSADHPHIKFGKQLKDNDTKDFIDGNFKNSGLTHFFTIKEIKKLYSDFKIIELVKQSNKSIFEDINSNYNSESFILILKKK